MIRRHFLAGGGLAAAALAAGCGDTEEDAPPRAAESRGGESSLADIALLNGMLGHKRGLLATYAGQAGRMAATIAAHEREHVAALEAAIRELGGEPERGETPASPEAAGGPAGGGGGRQAALRGERGAVALAIDTLAKLSDPATRSRLATILTADAEHAAALGDEPAAFVWGRP